MSLENSPRLNLPYLHAAQAQKEVFHNEALTLLDALVHARVESMDAAAPPAEPESGQCWIVGVDAISDWSGREGLIALWTQGGWRFIPAVEAMQIYVADRQQVYMHLSGSWQPGPLRSDGFYHGGVRVVGERQAAIGSPAGGAVIDIQARGAIEQILLALRAHGLISSE